MAMGIVVAIEIGDGIDNGDGNEEGGDYIVMGMMMVSYNVFSGIPAKLMSSSIKCVDVYVGEVGWRLVAVCDHIHKSVHEHTCVRFEHTQVTLCVWHNLKHIDPVAVQCCTKTLRMRSAKHTRAFLLNHRCELQCVGADTGDGWRCTCTCRYGDGGRDGDGYGAVVPRTKADQFGKDFVGVKAVAAVVKDDSRRRWYRCGA